MKIKTYYLILLSILSTQYLSSQNTKLKLKSGVNYFLLEGNKIDERDTTEYPIESGGVGYHIGYSVEYLFLPKFSILAGPEFSYRNHNIEADHVIGRPEFFYMSFPLMLNYRIPKGLKIGVGVRSDYLLRKRPFTYRQDNFDQGFLNYDFGLLAGLSYRIWNLEFDVRGSYGLVNIIFDKTSTPFNHALNNAKSRMLSFSCSYVLD